MENSLFSAAELAKVPPTERAARLTQLARQLGSLPAPLAELRREALIEARAAGHGVTTLAALTGLSRGRIYQLISTPAPAVAS
jgi:hypothetical protein